MTFPENAASRNELKQLISRLQEADFDRDLGSGWRVSTVLCHLAFWDQRVLHVLKQWQRSGFEPARPIAQQQIDSINEALKVISGAVPGRRAAQLALESAEAVDAQIEKLSGELVEQIAAAGFERARNRSLHRREHLRRIEEALAG